MRQVTASQLINFSVVTFSYTRFRKALIAQNIPRSSLPYQSLGQPYIAYIAMVCTIVMAFVGGYEVFLPGKWDIPTFFFSYTMIGVFPIIFFGWKFWHKSHIRKPEEIDLKTGLDEIDEYERNHVSLPSRYVLSILSQVFPTPLLFFAWLSILIAIYSRGLPIGFSAKAVYMHFCCWVACCPGTSAVRRYELNGVTSIYLSSSRRRVH